MKVRFSTNTSLEKKDWTFAFIPTIEIEWNNFVYRKSFIIHLILFVVAFELEFYKAEEI
jgi:hypothetical protein